MAVATKKPIIICKLCRVRVAVRKLEKEYCEGCREAMRKAALEAKNSGSDYPIYRLEMSYKYGDGPWRPQDMAERDRWHAWRARRSGVNGGAQGTEPA